MPGPKIPKAEFYNPRTKLAVDVELRNFKKGLFQYNRKTFKLMEFVVQALATRDGLAVAVAWDVLRMNFPDCLKKDYLAGLAVDEEALADIAELDLTTLVPPSKAQEDERKEILTGSTVGDLTMTPYEEMLWAKDAYGKFLNDKGQRPTEFPNSGCVAYFQMAQNAFSELNRQIVGLNKQQKGNEQSEDDKGEELSSRQLADRLEAEISALSSST